MNGTGDSEEVVLAADGATAEPQSAAGCAPGTEIHGGQGIQAGSGNVQYNFYGGPASAASRAGAAARTAPPFLAVTIEAVLGDDGMLESLVRAGEAEPCQRRTVFPYEVARVWTRCSFPGISRASGSGQV